MAEDVAAVEAFSLSAEVVWIGVCSAEEAGEVVDGSIESRDDHALLAVADGSALLARDDTLLEWDATWLTEGDTVLAGCDEELLTDAVDASLLTDAVEASLLDELVGALERVGLCDPAWPRLEDKLEADTLRDVLGAITLGDSLPAEDDTLASLKLDVGLDSILDVSLDPELDVSLDSMLDVSLGDAFGSG